MNETKPLPRLKRQDYRPADPCDVVFSKESIPEFFMTLWGTSKGLHNKVNSKVLDVLLWWIHFASLNCEYYQLLQPSLRWCSLLQALLRVGVEWGSRFKNRPLKIAESAILGLSMNGDMLRNKLLGVWFPNCRLLSNFSSFAWRLIAILVAIAFVNDVYGLTVGGARIKTRISEQTCGGKGETILVRFFQFRLWHYGVRKWFPPGEAIILDHLN